MGGSGELKGNGLDKNGKIEHILCDYKLADAIGTLGSPRWATCNHVVTQGKRLGQVYVGDRPGTLKRKKEGAKEL